MFSLAKYNEITPCIRGNDLLTSILDKNGISKLWLNSQHIFLTAKDDPNLYAFDIVPTLKWRRSVVTIPNDCVLDTSPDPVIEVIWDKSESSLVFVVFETGATNFWEFLQPSYEWIKHRSVQLSNAKGSQIIVVKWHEETGNLFWCEKRGFATDAYCVCYRSINICKESEKVKIDIGSTQAILHNCPLVSICVFNNGICIQPCQIYLERILMFWMSGFVNVKAVVINDGKVQDSVSSLSDFRDIAISLVGSWTENTEDKTWFGITTHASTRDLLLLNTKGALLKLPKKSNINKLVPVCNVKLPAADIHEFSHQVFSTGVTFGIIDCNSFVYIYDIVSGKLLQTLQEFNTRKVQILASNCKQTIFWASNGIWKLNCVPFNELVKTVVTCSENLTPNAENSNEERRNVVLPTKAKTMEQGFSEESEYNLEVKDVIAKPKVELLSQGLEVLDVVNWLYGVGLKHSAMVLLLEHVIAYSKNGDKVPESTLQFLKHLGQDVLQNPAILFTLFEEDLALKEESRSELKSFLDEIDQATVPSKYITPLNLKVLPFLRELYERWSEQIMISSVDLSILPKVLGESMSGVITAQTVVEGETDEAVLEKMEILSLQEPQQAVKAFVTPNGESLSLESEDGVNVADVLRVELSDRRWKRRHNVENTTILGNMFKLLYKIYPERLLDVLDMSSKFISEGASKDEATLQDLKDCVRDFMLDFLPNVWSEKECNLKRIKIHAQILLQLGLTRDALAIFLQRQLWQEAVEFYEEITRSSTNMLEVSQLYEILLSGVVRGSGTSQNQLLTKVFEMKPKLIETQNLFELCLRNMPGKWMECVFKEQCLTVGDAKKTLLKFLPTA